MSSDRNFVILQRGEARDNIILARFRNALRASTNPATGQPFTEDEVQRATQPGSRFYIEADAIDLLGMAQQQRGLAFASQIDPRRANTAMLEQVHGRLWLGKDSKLPAVGASGPVLATGVGGTVIPGSSTLGDPAAAVGVDPNGQRFQCMGTAIIAADKTAALIMKAIDGGYSTRIPSGTQIRWSENINPGTDPVATTLATFDGGYDVESDAEYLQRIEDRIVLRPASGNAAHFSSWCREASVAVEQAFVYPCALNAGTVLIAVTEKRGRPSTGVVDPQGPDARVPSLGTLQAVRDRIIPPESTVVPQRAHVYLTGINPQPSDLTIRLSMQQGNAGGWSDVLPWPGYSVQAKAGAITWVHTNGLAFKVMTDQSLPNDAGFLSGTDAPRLMLWDSATSRFVELDVQEITDPSPGASTLREIIVELNSEPELHNADLTLRASPVIAIGDRLSPYTDRATILSNALEAYFDSLGPGEVVAPTDPRHDRATRRPRISYRYPYRAGQAVIAYLNEALGGTAADVDLADISRTTPDLPTNIITGPNLITLGNVNVAPL